MHLSDYKSDFALCFRNFQMHHDGLTDQMDQTRARYAIWRGFTQQFRDEMSEMRSATTSILFTGLPVPVIGK